jgi:glycosyltransferase involved in cell wall biosynthesis
MKFVFVGYTSNPQYSDPQDWLFQIRAYLGVLESLAKEHEVISIEQIGYSGVLVQNAVQYHFIKPLHRRDYFPERLHHFIAAQSPDIILIHGMEHPLQLIHLRRTVGKHARIIVQSHSPKLPSGIKKWVQRFADRSVNAYFFSSKQMARPWLQHRLISNADKLFEVPVGSSVFDRVDRTFARNSTGMGEGKIFLWAGRLDHNKDPLTVVKAFLRFAQEDPLAKLYMIFQQNDLLQEVQQLLQQNKAGEQVILVGTVAHAAMQDWFCSADFFISSSHFEVFGAAVAESMSCGCIPLLSDIPAYRSITGNGACGILFHPGDDNALLGVLKSAVQMDLVLEEERTITWFNERLCFDAIAQRIGRIAASL